MLYFTGAFRSHSNPVNWVFWWLAEKWITTFSATAIPSWRSEDEGWMRQWQVSGVEDWMRQWQEV